MNAQKILNQLGFNLFESKIYIALLSGGEQAASQISQTQNIPRSTVRNTLDRFCEFGICQCIKRKNTQYYLARPPSYLVKYLTTERSKIETKIKTLKKQLPQLEHLYQKPKHIPKVQIFSGIDQVIEAFNLSLYSNTKEILIITEYNFFKNKKLKKNDDEFFVKQRIKRGIHARVLMSQNSSNSHLKLKAPEELRIRKVLPSHLPFPGNIYIYDRFVLHFSLDESPETAILTESETLSTTMRSLFESLWIQS